MYTIREASLRSGVGVPLLRAWERRYGVVAPDRTRSGYRLYDEAAIQRLRAMRRLIGSGWAARQAADRVKATPSEELESLGGAAAPDAAPGREDSPQLAPADALIGRLVTAARLLDVADLEAALDEAFTFASFETAAETVLMPALRAIGDAWERDEVGVAGEHAASQAVLRRLAMAYEAAGGGNGRRPVLVGLGPGSRHEFGALAFATAARRSGLPILYLGPDLPPDSWASAVVERDALAAVIGVPTAADVARAARVLNALRQARPTVLRAVGGDHAQKVVREDDELVLPRPVTGAVQRLSDAIGPSGHVRLG